MCIRDSYHCVALNLCTKPFQEIDLGKYYLLGEPKFRDPIDQNSSRLVKGLESVSYTHLRAHETVLDLVCRLLLEKKNKKEKIVCHLVNMVLTPVTSSNHITHTTF